MYCVLEVFHLQFASRSGVRFFSSLEEALAFASRHDAVSGECSGRCLGFFEYYEEGHTQRMSSVFPVEEGQEMQVPEDYFWMAQEYWEEHH